MITQEGSMDIKNQLFLISQSLSQLKEDNSHIKDKIYSLQKQTKLNASDLKGCIEGLVKYIEDSKTQTENSVLNILIQMEKKLSETHEIVVLGGKMKVKLKKAS